MAWSAGGGVMQDKLNELILVVAYLLKALPERTISNQMSALLERLEAIMRY